MASVYQCAGDITFRVRHASQLSPITLLRTGARCSDACPACGTMVGVHVVLVDGPASLELSKDCLSISSS